MQKLQECGKLDMSISKAQFLPSSAKRKTNVLGEVSVNSKFIKSSSDNGAAYLF